MDNFSAAWLVSDAAFVFFASKTLTQYPLYSCLQLVPPILDIPYHLSRESSDWAWTKQVAAVLQLSATLYAISQFYAQKRWSYIVGTIVTLLLPVTAFQVIVGPHYPPAGAGGDLWEQLKHPNRQDTPEFELCHTQGRFLLLLNSAIIAKGLLECSSKDDGEDIRTMRHRNEKKEQDINKPSHTSSQPYHKNPSKTSQQGKDAAITTKTSTSTTSSPKKTYMRRPPYYFKIGKLEWGYHGLLGISCLIVNIISICTVSSAAALLSQFLIHFQCRDSLKMIALSPSFSPIIDIKWPWGGVTKISAEHKPAFRLTIDVLHYVTVRVITKLLLGMVSGWEDASTVVFWTMYTVQLWRCWRLNPLHVYPFQKFLTHLQPWLLLVPMGLGVALDACQLLIGQDRIEMITLLQIQAVCLWLAFLFTMAFRKYVGMSWLYGISVAIIWGITLYAWTLLWDTIGDIQDLWVASTMEEGVWSSTQAKSPRKLV
jgi:hypothetical protein